MNGVMLEEVFKPVPEFEDKYEVSNYGRVRRIAHKTSVKTDKFVGYQKNYKEYELNPSTDKMGYLHVRLSGGINNLKIYKVHQLVAMVFLDYTPGDRKIVVTHKDFNRKNNFVQNLQVVTKKEQANRYWTARKEAEEAI